MLGDGKTIRVLQVERLLVLRDGETIGVLGDGEGGLIHIRVPGDGVTIGVLGHGEGYY